MCCIRRYLPLLAVTFTSLSLAATDLPEFALKDPANIEHTHRTLLERGTVLVVTIPNVKHGAIQSWYVKQLKERLAVDGPLLVILEDLSQSNVRGLALKNMRSKYQPGTGPLLLLDEEGRLRRDLGIPNDETEALVFDQSGRLLLRVTGWTTADEVKDACKTIVATARRIADAGQRENAHTVAEK